jgi:uncharacterized protein (DUF2147 family)
LRDLGAAYARGGRFRLLPAILARGDLVKLTGLIPSALAALTVCAGLSALPAMAQDTSAVPAGKPAAPIVGTWRTLTGTEINVTPCGGDKFCGTFSYIVIPAKDAETCRNTPHDEFAALILDYQNPNKNLQSRPLLGFQALKLTPTSKQDAYDANIYNAEEGKTYDVQMWVKGDTLTLAAGCFGSMCAVTQDWPRVPNRPAPDFTCEGGV